MTSGTSANGMPKDSTTWVSTKALVGLAPGRQDRQCGDHGDRPAGQQRDPEPDESGHHDLAGVGANAGRRDARGEQRYREHQRRAAAGEPAKLGVRLADGVQSGQRWGVEGAGGDGEHRHVHQARQAQSPAPTWPR
jgi:hypothetical protein